MDGMLSGPKGHKPRGPRDVKQPQRDREKITTTRGNTTTKTHSDHSDHRHKMTKKDAK